MGQKRRYGALSGIVCLVVFLIYNLLVFLMFRGFNAVFWVSYGFMLAVYLLHIVCVLGILGDVSARAVFFGIPLGVLSVYFVGAEFLTSMVFMLIRHRAGVKAAVLVQAVLLCLFVVMILAAVMTRDAVSHMASGTEERVRFIKGMNTDVEMLLRRSGDLSVKGALKKLSETIKYSDPMSNSAVADQERRIMQSLSELRVRFDAGDMVAVQELCPAIELLFAERNKTLMASK